MSFVVPSRPTPQGTCCLPHLAVRGQGHQREQPQQCRCGPSDRQIRPLALRLESQVPAHLLEGHLQLPAHHKPTEDLLRISVEVGTQEGLGFEPSFRITDQDPAHGHGEQPSGVPNGRLGSDLDHALSAPVPVSDLGWLPNGGRVLGHLGKVGQPLTLYARPPYLMRASWRSRFIEGSIQAQAGYEGDRIGELVALVEQFERGVGAIGHCHDLPLWVPAPYLQEQLPSPFGYLLVASTPLGSITSEGARAERKGKAHIREAQGTSTNNIMQTHLRPLLFTKVSWVERTGSRETPL